MYYIEYIISPIIYFLFNCITFAANVFIKRDESIILMGSTYGERFAGNSRFLFQYLSINKEEYGLRKVIWVTRKRSIYRELGEMGYDVYMMHSPMSFFYHLKAGKHAINFNSNTSYATGVRRRADIMGYFSLGATHYFLNHAAYTGKGNLITNCENLNFLLRALVKVYVKIYNVDFLRHLFLTAGGWDKVTFLASGEANKESDKRFKISTKGINYVSTGYPEMCPPIGYTESEKEILKIFRQNKRIVFTIYLYFIPSIS